MSKKNKPRAEPFNARTATREADRLVRDIRPMLARRSPEVVGAALAELLAIFIASHAPPLRDSSLKLLLECTDGLIPLWVDRMIQEGRVPPDWGKEWTQ